MTTYFISRHAGAIAWARSQGYEPDHWIEHLDISVIKAGDTVTGTLPIPMAAAVCALGADYQHLDVPQSREQRGHEMTAGDLHKLGATMRHYWVQVQSP